MRRREFIVLTAARPQHGRLLPAHNKPAMPVVGFLRSTPTAPFAHPVQQHSTRSEAQTGFVEGQNVAIEVSLGQQSTGSAAKPLAADLVRRQDGCNSQSNGPFAVQAAKAATTTIPIVSRPPVMIPS